MPQDTSEWLREIDHTGDIGIQITAPTLPQLFERAAAGTFQILTDPETVRASASTPVTIHGPDLEALMVKWLSELNYRHVVDDVLFATFEVEGIDEGDAGLDLNATVFGEPIDPDRHTVHTEIKAITYHGLEVHRIDDGWSVQVIFDM